MAIVFLKPNNNWKSSDARFAAYLWGDDVEATWLDLEEFDDSTYYLKVPQGYQQIIFCRMNPASIENNWNKDTNFWNQTEDLNIPSQNKMCFTLNEDTWDKGGYTTEIIDTEAMGSVQYMISVDGGSTVEGTSVPTKPVSVTWGENGECTIYPDATKSLVNATVTPEVDYIINGNTITFLTMTENINDITITLGEATTIHIDPENITGDNCSVSISADQSTTIDFGGSFVVNFEPNKGYQAKGFTIIDGNGKKHTNYIVVASEDGKQTIEIKNVKTDAWTIKCCLEDGYYLYNNAYASVGDLTTNDKMEKDEAEKYVIEKDFSGTVTEKISMKVVQIVNGKGTNWCDPWHLSSALMVGEAVKNESDYNNIEFEYTSSYPKFRISCIPTENKYDIVQKYRVTQNTKNCTITLNKENGIYLWSDNKQLIATLVFADEELSCSYGATMGGREVDSDWFTQQEGELKPTYVLTINVVDADVEITAQQASRLKQFLLTDLTDMSQQSQTLAEDAEEISFLNFEFKKDHTYTLSHGGRRLSMIAMWNYRTQTSDEINNYSCTAAGDDKGAFNDNFTVRLSEFTPNEDFKCNLYIRIVENATKARLWIDVADAEKATITFNKDSVYDIQVESGRIFGISEKYTYKKTHLYIKFVPKLGYKIYSISANDIKYTSQGKFVPVELVVTENVVFNPEMEVTGAFTKIILFDKNTDESEEIPLYPKTDVSNISYASEEKTLKEFLDELLTTLASLDRRIIKNVEDIEFIKSKFLM